MNRRGFLRLCAAAPVVALVPAVAAPVARLSRADKAILFGIHYGGDVHIGDFAALEMRMAQWYEQGGSHVWRQNYKEVVKTWHEISTKSLRPRLDYAPTSRT